MDWSNCMEKIDSGTGADAGSRASLRCIQVVYGNLGNALFVFAGIIAVFFIAWSGIQLITSAGDPVRVASARRSFMYAIFGLVIIIMAYFIIQLVARVTGTDCSALGISC